MQNCTLLGLKYLFFKLNILLNISSILGFYCFHLWLHRFNELQPCWTDLLVFTVTIISLFWIQEFKTSGSSNVDTSKVTGTLETKYKWAEYGLTFTEKWTTENTLGTEICVEDQVNFKRPDPGHQTDDTFKLGVNLKSVFLQLTKGLKLTFDTTFSPNTGWEFNF